MARRASSKKSAEGTTVSVGKRRLTLTRLEKVLFPGTGFTKAEMIDYYVRIAPVLLPHLTDRPVTLKRYPDGVKGQAFYEKDAPSFTPEWVRTFPVPRRAGGEPIHYIVIEEPAALAWTANAGSIELHPFLHRVPKLDQPTAVVFDLDPGEGANFLSCVEVALLVRGVLEKLSLEVFPKVSGSKGLQLYVPLNSAVTYAATRPFARGIAKLLEKQRPDCVVSEMAKEKRTRRVFIDWSQNSDYKTTVGVYSLRAKRERPYVSAPVSWQELEQAARRKDPEALLFTPRQVLERVDKLGDLFAPVSSVRQRLPGDVTEAAKAEVRRIGRMTSNLRRYADKRGWTKVGHQRHSTFLGLCEDKDPRSVIQGGIRC